MIKIKPIHPGEHLAEYIEEYGITVYRLAKDIYVPTTRIDQIVKCKRGITADTALRLSKYFGTSSQYWMNLQSQYELETTHPEEIDSITNIAA